MRFYLGTHQAHWLGAVDIPLFVSHRRLCERKSFPRASAAWALDSGAFTELSTYGKWTVSESEYAEYVKIYSDEIGMLEWAAPQDWMCEPFMLEKTKLSVSEHQQRTVDNFLRLRSMSEGIHFIPVLQGWSADDYLWCWELYDRAGIDLANEQIVGVGSVCRRQATGEALEIFYRLRPLRLHGFGVKIMGIRRMVSLLSSSDSMAWSYDARRRSPLPGHIHKNCANCLEYALLWRDRVIKLISEPNGRELDVQWEILYEQIMRSVAVGRA